ncbi:carbohydrate ABC transporter permease [Pseudoclavibacter sp. AY1F1]|uniref:carbohydrate ABC transporter permease n=1 Tax=Pseudoclavibacter sp. AY1F1 TaxID=2080583 RepID=UPI001C664EEA|nr:sugar ABC transporter permease [Pseudoclavibacter sp. AY1F1]
MTTLTDRVAPPNTVTGHPGPSQKRRSNRRNRLFPYLLVTPAVIMFVLVIGYPFIQSLLFGFFDRSLLADGGPFVGLENLADLVSGADFWAVASQTAVFVVVSTLGAFILALAMALALNSKLRGRAFWRTAFLLPWILPGVVVSFLWMWIFDTNYGLLNGIVVLFGGSGGINWLDTPSLAMAAVIVAKVWHSFPWMAILILAALQGIPDDVHDAAAVDGASGWKKQAYVILPQIKPALALTLLLETIWGLQHFEIPYVMTGGGPVGSTTTLSVDLYQAAFTRFDLGEAGAIGILWTLIMAALVAVYVVHTTREDRKANR